MRPLTSIVLSAALALTPAAAGDGAGATVAGWVERLRTADSAKDRQTALTALRSLAAGPTENPRTREAAFALADAGIEEGTGRDLDAVVKATTLYPGDPRTPALLRNLATAQLEAGDRFGAHLVFRKLMAQDARPTELLPVAAANAARVEDMDAAFEWSRAVGPDARRTPEQASLADRALLISSAALGRHEQALEAYRRLAKSDPEGLRTDAQSLAAAARTLDDVGLAEEALRAYVAFVNVHTKAPERPDALLSLGRLMVRTERTKGARQYLDWLIRDHPDTRAAHEARLDLLALDGEPGAPSKIAGYLAAIRQATDAASAVRACRRFSEAFVGAGRPIELVDAVASLVRDDRGEDDALTAMVARECLGNVLDPVLELLASRDDLVGVAAAAAEAESVGVAVPAARSELVDRARRVLGLPARETPVTRAIAAARAGGPDGDWEAAVNRLRNALAGKTGSSPEAIAEAKRWIGEGLWRLDRNDEARDVLEQALSLPMAAAERRSIEVLLADVTFAAGDLESACTRYREANRLWRTKWVDRQLERCDGPAA